MEPVLLVGESNPHSDDPEFALLPWPRGAAGDRLRRILGYSDRKYLTTFDRVNLLPSGARWSAAKAETAATELSHKRRVLLGSRVCAAHRVPFEPFRRFSCWPGGPKVLVLPHPSGRCRIWNDESLIKKARRAVGRFLRPC